MDLSVVLVNHNSGHRLRNCVESLLAHPPSCRWEAAVVDSGSTDGSADFLRGTADPRIRLLERGNIGYTAAINLGFRATKGRLVLLLNADMVVLEGAVDAMARHLEEDPGLGAVGGHCQRPDGTFEWRYVASLHTPWTAYLSTFRPKDAPRMPRYRRHALLDEDFSKPVAVQQPAGGCLMVRRSLFGDELASERFGIYWSDVAIAHHIHDAGKSVMVFPDARFIHDHAEPEPGHRLPWPLRADYSVGCVRYFRLFGGRGQAAQVKALFAYAIAMRLAWKVAAAALGREPRSEVGAQARFLAAFLRGRNPFLERT